MPMGTWETLFLFIDNLDTRPRRRFAGPLLTHCCSVQEPGFNCGWSPKRRKL